MIKVQLPLIFLLLFPAFGLWAGDDLNTSLLSAAEAGDTAKVESLLDRGADIEPGIMTAGPPLCGLPLMAMPQ